MNAFDPTVHTVDAILHPHEARLDLETREERQSGQKRQRHLEATDDDSTEPNVPGNLPPPDGVGTQINMEV